MQRWFSISKSFLLSGFLVVGLSHLGLSEIIGKSIAKVNGDAIFLSEFENNWGSLLEQRQQMAPGVEIPAAWKKEQKKVKDDTENGKKKEDPEYRLFLTQYTNDFARAAMSKWWELGDKFWGFHRMGF